VETKGKSLEETSAMFDEPGIRQNASSPPPVELELIPVGEQRTVVLDNDSKM